MNIMKKYILSAVAVVLAVTISAFTSPKTISATQMNTMAIQNWYYTGPDLAHDKDATEYSSMSQSCDGVDQVPCEISFDASSFTIPTSHTPLQNYLNSKSTTTDVLNSAVSVRSE
jgi:hypothetical protein